MSTYRAVNTLLLCYKTNQLLLYKEIDVDCSEIHKCHGNELCGQNVNFLRLGGLQR